MEAKEPELTVREQAYFEHVRAAKEQGVSLTAYCERLGLNVRSLYGVRRDLVEKGIVPRTLTPKTVKKRPSKFVAVRLAAGGTNGTESVCRVRHPSGWTIECRDWPQASWVSALLSGGEHAAA
ncbi:MAG: IS66 family insertion sequence element accessory protein TnpA [Woeseiaceae bacterium]